MEFDELTFAIFPFCSLLQRMVGTVKDSNRPLLIRKFDDRIIASLNAYASAANAEEAYTADEFPVVNLPVLSLNTAAADAALFAELKNEASMLTARYLFFLPLRTVYFCFSLHDEYSVSISLILNKVAIGFGCCFSYIAIFPIV
ncbi:hypothetical protein PIB30_108635 [Stylosanthes scabra]|uniref:Uncharacterized protein n=1 Tax=Stylosanthes scabra TaxID=79078 RepID=A0ABU6ZY55_9FABA|nr:hypothetical protein [Stylosanthes scabra]